MALTTNSTMSDELGGGQSQVLPAEKINLHFTGDKHAVTAAHNILRQPVINRGLRTGQGSIIMLSQSQGGS